MSAHRYLALLTLSLLLTACGGDDGGDSFSGGGGGGSITLRCDTVSGGAATTEGSVDPGCVGCEVQSAGAASDDDVYSYASMVATTGAPEQATYILATAQAGVVYPAGSVASAFVTTPSGANGVSVVGNRVITLTTYLAGAVQEAATAGVGLGTVTNAPLRQQDLPLGGSPDLPQDFLSFTTTQPFDAVEISFGSPGAYLNMPTLKVHGLCWNGSVS